MGREMGPRTCLAAVLIDDIVNIVALSCAPSRHLKEQNVVDAKFCIWQGQDHALEG